jgi:hypothetical protein
MTEKATNPNQISIFDESPEGDQPQEGATQSYNFSAVDSFPSAEAAHKQQEEQLDANRENQGMNPANLGFQPESSDKSHQNPVNAKPKTNNSTPKNNRPLSGRAATVADTNGIRAAHFYGTK